MLQVTPDYNLVGTKTQLTRDILQIVPTNGRGSRFRKFPFSGPGLYLADKSFILVVPFPTKNHGGNPWKNTWPNGTKFTAYVYHCRFDQSIFSYASFPVRQDLRNEYEKDPKAL